MNQLPTGMYQPGTSLVHRMKANIKIFCFLILTVAVICTETLWGYAVLLLFTGILIYLSKVNFGTALGSIGRLTWFFILILLMNICFYGPDDAWIRIGIFAPSYEGLMQGTHIVARVILMLVICNVLTVTTAPLMLTEGMEALLFPLKLFRVPTEQVAMILSVAMQFIPTLFEEAEMIKKAQIARGARFDSKKLLDKAGAILPLVVPIFLAAFKRADELSLAMEARGYRIDMARQRRKFGMPAGFEWLALATCSILCILQIMFL